MRKRDVQVVKRSINQLNSSIVQEQLHRLTKKAIGKTFHKFGWNNSAPKVDHKADTDGHTYTATLTFLKRQQRERGNSEAVFDKQFGDIVRKLISGGRALGWTPTDNQSKQVTELIATTEGKQEFNVVTPDDWGKHFRHIFDRDPQIRIVYSAIQAAKASGFIRRNHCLLWGKPACGKTDTLLAFERMLGSENVIKLDATMTTKAGAENLLLEMDSIPPIMILEEAEKINPVNLSWMLGVLDQRGEIIKTNARIGSVRKEAKCLVLATVNNLAEFQTIMAGALASRFQHKLYFPRPTRAVLEKILTREIQEIKGNAAWIKAALDYCLDVEKTDDPRRAIAILDGKDKLLTGEYQKDLMRIHKAMVDDGATPPPN